MGDKTRIAWTEATWNPVTGCSKVSPGCAHCYAEALSLRFGFTSKPWTAGNAAENVVCHPERLDMPLRWRRPRRIFVNSMSDLFHEQVPSSYIYLVWTTMFYAKHHTYQVLTKRPERLREWTEQAARAKGWPVEAIWPDWIWLGVSVEYQRQADERIPILLDTPAAVRFVSCEPLLGPVDLSRWLDPLGHLDGFCRSQIGKGMFNEDQVGSLRQPALDWVIVGGESGPKRRPMDLDWARAIRDACIADSVPFFFKQQSALRPGQGTLLDGMEWHQLPEEA